MFGGANTNQNPTQLRLLGRGSVGAQAFSGRAAALLTERQRWARDLSTDLRGMWSRLSVRSVQRATGMGPLKVLEFRICEALGLELVVARLKAP